MNHTACYHVRPRRERWITRPRHRFYELLNAGDIDGFGNLLSDNFVDHEELPGSDEGRCHRALSTATAAFPDLRMVPEDLIASGRQGRCARADDRDLQGRVHGHVPGIFGKRIDVQLIDIIRFDDDGRARALGGLRPARDDAATRCDSGGASGLVGRELILGASHRRVGPEPGTRWCFAGGQPGAAPCVLT